MKFGKGDFAGFCRLASEDECGSLVFFAQEVLCEVQSGVWKPLRSRELIEVVDDLAVWLGASDVSEFPHCSPKVGDRLNRPFSQFLIRLKRKPISPVDQFDEC